jgi:hypothetical protein
MSNDRECPFYGIAYDEVPGYVIGYGCPVCEAIGTAHVTMTESELQQAITRLITEAQSQERKTVLADMTTGANNLPWNVENGDKWVRVSGVTDLIVKLGGV